VFSARFLIIIPLLATAVCFIAKREHQLAVKSLLAILIANIISEISKAVIPVNRPFVGVSPNPGIWIPFGFGSFFSGHIATLFALGILLYKKHQKLALMCFCFGALIGALRVLIKVHYPIDIVGGAAVGVLAGLIAIRVKPIWV